MNHLLVNVGKYFDIGVLNKTLKPFTMSKKTLIKASSENKVKSEPIEIVGINSIVVTGAKGNDRVKITLDGAPGCVISGNGVHTLRTGLVSLQAKIRNNSGSEITVTIKTSDAEIPSKAVVEETPTEGGKSFSSKVKSIFKKNQPEEG